MFLLVAHFTSATIPTTMATVADEPSHEPTGDPGGEPGGEPTSAPSHGPTVDPAGRGDEVPAEGTDGGPGDRTPEVPPAAAMLARSPFCLALRYARSTEDVCRSVLVAEFESAADYRRALSPFDIRTEVVPWLSTAEVTWSGVSEVLLSADAGRLRTHVPTVVPPNVQGPPP